MKTDSVSSLPRTAARGLRLAIVGARFNPELSDALVRGAKEAFIEHGGSELGLIIVRVPGSYEVPLAVQAMATAGDVDCVVATGVIVRGETAHFDHLSASVTTTLQELMLTHEVPIGFGIVLANTLEQAIERSTGEGNKGREAALAAIEMASWLRELREEGG